MRLDDDDHPDWATFHTMAKYLAGGTTAKSSTEVLLGQIAKGFWGIAISNDNLAKAYLDDGDEATSKEFQTRAHERRLAASEVLQGPGDTKGIKRK